jgi:hypothetical protein
MPAIQVAVNRIVRFFASTDDNTHLKVISQARQVEPA